MAARRSCRRTTGARAPTAPSGSPPRGARQPGGRDDGGGAARAAAERDERDGRRAGKRHAGPRRAWSRRARPRRRRARRGCAPPRSPTHRTRRCAGRDRRGHDREGEERRRGGPPAAHARLSGRHPSAGRPCRGPGRGRARWSRPARCPSFGSGSRAERRRASVPADACGPSSSRTRGRGASGGPTTCGPRSRPPASTPRSGWCRPGCAEAAAAAVRDGADVVIAAGGDGTVSAVAGALAGTGTALGVLPLGTLNHFARDLGIPAELDAAARVVAAGSCAASTSAR